MAGPVPREICFIMRLLRVKSSSGGCFGLFFRRGEAAQVPVPAGARVCICERRGGQSFRHVAGAICCRRMREENSNACCIPIPNAARHAPRGASGLSRWHADPGRSRSGSRLLRFHRSFLLTLRSKLWRMQASLSTLGSPRTIVKEFALISCPPGNTRQSCTCKDSARLLETDRGRQFSLMLTEA
jgi:hypothetical protein